MEAQRPGWLKEGRINVLLQYGMAPNPMFPGVPLAIELTKTPRERRIFVPYDAIPAQTAQAFLAAEDHGFFKHGGVGVGGLGGGARGWGGRGSGLALASVVMIRPCRKRATSRFRSGCVLPVRKVSASRICRL